MYNENENCYTVGGRLVIKPVIVELALQSGLEQKMRNCTLKFVFKSPTESRRIVILQYTMLLYSLRSSICANHCIPVTKFELWGSKRLTQVSQVYKCCSPDSTNTLKIHNIGRPCTPIHLKPDLYPPSTPALSNFYPTIYCLPLMKRIKT